MNLEFTIVFLILAVFLAVSIIAGSRRKNKEMKGQQHGFVCDFCGGDGYCFLSATDKANPPHFCPFDGTMRCAWRKLG